MRTTVEQQPSGESEGQLELTRKQSVGLIAGAVVVLGAVIFYGQSSKPSEESFSFPPYVKPSVAAADVRLEPVVPFTADDPDKRGNPCYVETEQGIAPWGSTGKTESDIHCLDTQRNSTVTLVDFDGNLKKAQELGRNVAHMLTTDLPGVPLGMAIEVAEPSAKAKAAYERLPDCNTPTKDRVSPATVALKYMNLTRSSYVGSLSRKGPCGKPVGIAYPKEGFFDVNLNGGDTSQSAITTIHELSHVAFYMGHYGTVEFRRGKKIISLSRLIDRETGVIDLLGKLGPKQIKRTEYDPWSGNIMGNPYRGRHAAFNPVQIQHAQQAATEMGMTSKDLPVGNKEVVTFTSASIEKQEFVTSERFVDNLMLLQPTKDAAAKEPGPVNFNQFAVIPLEDSSLGPGIQRVQVMLTNDAGDISVLGELTSKDQPKLKEYQEPGLAIRWWNYGLRLIFHPESGTVSVANLHS